MMLSENQVNTFWRLWPKACQANGWTRDNGMTTVQIDAKRKELLLDCGFTSLTLVDRKDGFTKVKNKLLILIGVDVEAGKEDQDTTANTARTHRWVIENEIIPCLALYEEDVTGYIATVIAGKIRYYKTDRPERPPTLSDLTPSQMAQCLSTLSARLNTKRKASGDSIHDMKIRAGVKCTCAKCSRKQPMTRQEVALVTGDPDWTV